MDCLRGYLYRPLRSGDADAFLSGRSIPAPVPGMGGGDPLGGVLCQNEAIVPLLEEKRLDAWTHNKAIQKVCESNRVTAERKLYLRGLKV